MRKSFLLMGKLRNWTMIEVGDRVIFQKDHLELIMWFHRMGPAVKATISKFEQKPEPITTNVVNRCTNILEY